MGPIKKSIYTHSDREKEHCMMCIMSAAHTHVTQQVWFTRATTKQLKRTEASLQVAFTATSKWEHWHLQGFCGRHLLCPLASLQKTDQSKNTSGKPSTCDSQFLTFWSNYGFLKLLYGCITTLEVPEINFGNFGTIWPHLASFNSDFRFLQFYPLFE